VKVCIEKCIFLNVDYTSFEIYLLGLNISLIPALSSHFCISPYTFFGLILILAFCKS